VETILVEQAHKVSGLKEGQDTVAVMIAIEAVKEPN